MIYFQTKPDAVFEALVREALASESSEIQLLSDDGAIDSWEGLYPTTSQYLCPYTAMRVLAQLLAAMNDSQVYRLTDLHWLVLYETLKNFCATHNDLLDEFNRHTRPVGEYTIGEVDGEALFRIYFWDTDFLVCRRAEIFGESWGNGDGESESDDERQETGPCQQDDAEEPVWGKGDAIPALEPVDEPGWLVGERDEYFRPGSTRYPDYGDE